MFSNLKTVRPPNPDYYLSRCKALRRYLYYAHKTPPVMIANGCWDVLREVFGGQYRAFFYVLLGILYSLWEDILYLTQHSWHMYIRLRTPLETAERMFQPSVDVDAISNLKNEEEFQEYLAEMLSEDKDYE